MTAHIMFTGINIKVKLAIIMYIRMLSQLIDYSLGELKKKIQFRKYYYVIVNSPNEGFLHQLPNDIIIRTSKNNEKHFSHKHYMGVGYLCKAILPRVVIVTAIKSKVKGQICKQQQNVLFSILYGYPCGLTEVKWLIVFSEFVQLSVNFYQE